MHASVLPIGSGNITNDLAIGLKVPIQAAEALKLTFGYAVAKDIPIREKLDMSKINAEIKTAISRRFFSEIIEIRLAEMFELINNELKAIDREKNLPAGVVLTGGGSKLPGVVDLARRELKLPAQLGIVTGEMIKSANREVEERMEDPEYAASVGLVLQGYDEIKKGERKIGNPLRGLLKYFLP